MEKIKGVGKEKVNKKRNKVTMIFFTPSFLSNWNLQPNTLYCNVFYRYFVPLDHYLSTV